MDLKRRIALAAALVAVGLGAGHLVQDRSAKPQGQTVAKAGIGSAQPTAITPLAAGGSDTDISFTAPTETAISPQPMQPAIAEPQAAVVVGPIQPVVDEEPRAASLTDPVEMPRPEVADPAPALPLANEAPMPTKALPVDTAAGNTACDVQLDLLKQPNAMIGLTLQAPCRPNERVVLRHAGLAITAKTTSTGSVFMVIPAMQQAATVSALFADGNTVDAAIDMPDVAGFRRFTVQWMADDAFQMHAFENGADYGTPGHISAANPHQPLAGVPAVGGFLMMMGDNQVDMPMLAEVYTYPKAADAKVAIVIESVVSASTCGRELLGETLISIGGAVDVNDLTVAMPDCDAMGDILVLKNLVPDMKIAAN